MPERSWSRTSKPARLRRLRESFVAAAHAIYFAAFQRTSGYEPWVSDGSGNGTRLLCDLAPGPTSSNPAGLICCGCKLYFAATDPKAGQELFVIDAPGATVEHVGAGCAPSFPTMTPTPPILGKTATFSGTFAPTGHFGVVVLGIRGAPYTLPALFGNGCCAIPNLLHPTFQLLPGILVAPTWSYPLPLPNSTGLQGMCLAFQSWWISRTTIFPIATSNSVILGLGR